MLWIWDVYPGSLIQILSISDPGFDNSTRGGGNFFVLPFSVAVNIIKLRIFFKAKTLRIIVLFTQNFFNKLSKIWAWDPRSRIRKKPFPDPGSKRHRILNPDPQNCFFSNLWTGRVEPLSGRSLDKHFLTKNLHLLYFLVDLELSKLMMIPYCMSELGK